MEQLLIPKKGQELFNTIGNCDSVKHFKENLRKQILWKRARRCTFFNTIGNCDSVKHFKENLRKQILWKRARRCTFFIQ